MVGVWTDRQQKLQVVVGSRAVSDRAVKQKADDSSVENR